MLCSILKSITTHMMGMILITGSRGLNGIVVTDTLNCPEIANLICHDPANVRDIKCISHTQMTASLVNRDSRHLLFWVFQ